MNHCLIGFAFCSSYFCGFWKGIPKNLVLFCSTSNFKGKAVCNRCFFSSHAWEFSLSHFPNAYGQNVCNTQFVSTPFWWILEFDGQSAATNMFETYFLKEKPHETYFLYFSIYVYSCGCVCEIYPPNHSYSKMGSKRISCIMHSYIFFIIFGHLFSLHPALAPDHVWIESRLVCYNSLQTAFHTLSATPTCKGTCFCKEKIERLNQLMQKPFGHLDSNNVLILQISQPLFRDSRTLQRE